MKKNPLLLILGLALFSCGKPGGPPATSSSGSRFRTTPPSLLYFKNIRSVYYERSEQKGSRIELYRLRKFGQLEQKHTIVPVIANNWLEDEAYLLLEAEGPAFATPLTIRWKTGSGEGVYRLQPAGADKQYEMAMQLYESLQAGHQLSAMRTDSTWIPVLEGKDVRSYFSTAVRDYLRLTEAW